jgi:hypothetical protein
MPGNVTTATITEVLPNGLASAFTEGQDWPILANDPYADGRTQRKALAENSRKFWQIGRMLTQTEWSTLLVFYEARKGPLEPFFFYPDPTTYDEDGESTTGRWAVRFQGSIGRAIGPGRGSAEFALIQIA